MGQNRKAFSKAENRKQKTESGNELEGFALGVVDHGYNDSDQFTSEWLSGASPHHLFIAEIAEAVISDQWAVNK